MKKLFFVVMPLLLLVGLGAGFYAHAQSATGTLIVIKNVVNDNGGTANAANSTINVSGTNVSPSAFAGSTSGTTVTLAPGSYSVVESPQNGYIASYSADCSGSINAGETKTCTVTNNDIAANGTGTVTIVTNVKNLPGGTSGTLNPGNFTYNISGTNPSQTSVAGSASGTAVTFSPGSYNITAPATAGYNTSFSSGCSGTIAAGQNITCTITNVDTAMFNANQGALLIYKHVINDNGGIKSANDFTVNISGNNVSVTGIAGEETGGIVTLDPGAYSIDESPMNGYAKTLSGECSGTITAGQLKTCTITNDDNIAGATSNLPGMPTTGFDDTRDYRPLILASIIFMAALGVMYIRYSQV